MEVYSGIPASRAIGCKLSQLFPELITRGLFSYFERALQGQISVLSTALHGYLLELPPSGRETGFDQMKQTARIAPLASNGVVEGTIVVIEDVTQREWTSETLRRQHKRDEILSWALADLLKAEDPRHVARELFCKIVEYLDFDTYLLYLFNPADSLFTLCNAGGITPETEQSIHTIPAETLSWFEEAKEGNSILQEHFNDENDTAFPFTRNLGFRSFILLPLLTSTELHGFLSFATRTREKIDSHEAELLRTIAQYLAMALKREKLDRELREAQMTLQVHAQDLERNVAERTASLKQIIAELQTFSYTIAHDLRAPIRALIGYCEVLCEDYSAAMPSDAKEIVSRLSTAALQMDALTRDLLEFSKISRQDITLGSVDLAQQISEVLSSSGDEVRSFVSVKHPLHHAYANPTLVRQCLSNLLENAVKFSKPATDPAVTIWSEIVSQNSAATTETTHFIRSRYSIMESAAGEDSMRQPESNPNTRVVRLWIEDNGVGISPQAQSKIFGIFDRGDRAGEYEGTGIGLAIVARAMERMGGHCGVESELGKGSRFWLEFGAPPLDPTEP